jgi:F0F1-type ATP synthase membrane subunit b/b'
VNDAEALQFEQIAKWSQVVCAIAFFIFLVWAIRKYVVPAVEAAAKHRDVLMAEVGHARAEVEEADRDALAIGSRAKDDAARERERILHEAQADGERTVRNAEGELGRARIAANAALRADFIDRALARARQEAGAKISDAENLRLVNGTVDALTGGRA